MTEIEEALEWADWLAKVKDPGPALMAAKQHATILARDLRWYRSAYWKLRGAQEHYEKWLDKEWPPVNPSLDEALNSGDGTYKP